MLAEGFKPGSIELLVHGQSPVITLGTMKGTFVSKDQSSFLMAVVMLRGSKPHFLGDLPLAGAKAG